MQSGVPKAVVRAVLFDLGNTLAAYYRAEEFRPVLERSIRAVSVVLRARGRDVAPLEQLMAAAEAENREAADHKVRPMTERLGRIFSLQQAEKDTLAAELCNAFLQPIFALGQLYDTSLPVLAELKRFGVRTAVVSNTPWGSPSEPWMRELRRLGIAQHVDCALMCGDVGWRKPAPQLFLHAAERLGVSPRECLFVGDDVRWDIEGSEAAGMQAVLVDRDDRHVDYRGPKVRDLYGVLRMVVTHA